MTESLFRLSLRRHFRDEVERRFYVLNRQQRETIASYYGAVVDKASAAISKKLNSIREIPHYHDPLK
jgi:hypothetical protein